MVALDETSYGSYTRRALKMWYSNYLPKRDRGLPHPSLRQLTIESNSRNLAMTGDVAYG
jgi:hypothetical protein